MSWFSIGFEGKKTWDSHNFVNSILSGNIVGGVVFKYIIQENCLYQRMRSISSEAMAEKILPKLTPYSRDIAIKILDQSIEEKKIYYVAAKIRNQIQFPTKQGLIAAGKSTATILKNATVEYLKREKPANNSDVNQQPSNHLSGAKLIELVNFVYANYVLDDALTIIGLLKAGKIKEMAKQATVKSLQPMCEKAVQNTMKASIKAGGNFAVDTLTRKALSLTLVPLIYKLCLTTLETAAQTYSFQYSNEIEAFAPSATTVLWTYTAYNIVGITFTIFKTCYLQTRNSQDKENARQLVQKLAKEPLRKKLETNGFLTLLGLAQEKQMMEALAEVFINEAIELYWNNLHEVKVLGLPLVN